MKKVISKPLITTIILAIMFLISVSAATAQDFDEFYNTNGRKAGTYTYSNDRWVME